MQNFQIMQCLQSSGNLNYNTPYLLLTKLTPIFSMLHNFFIQIAIISELHNDTEWPHDYYK